MKKNFIITLVICCILSLAGCSKTAADYYKSAQKYLTAGNYEQAIENYNEVLKLDPKNKDAYAGLIEAYTKNGQTDKYISTLQLEIENIPDSDKSVYVELVDACITSGDKEEYTSIIDFVLNYYTGNDPQFYIDIASEYNKNKLTEEYYKILNTGYGKTSSAIIKELLDNQKTGIEPPANIKELINGKKVVGNASALMNQMLQVQGLFVAEEPEGGCKYNTNNTKYYYYANNNKIDFCAYYSSNMNQLFIKSSGDMWEFTITYSDTDGLTYSTTSTNINVKINIKNDSSFSLNSLVFDVDGKLTSTKNKSGYAINYPVMVTANYDRYINLSNQALERLGVQVADFINTDFLKYYMTEFTNR